LSHALESFHRRTSDETEVDTTTHEQRLREILESVPEEHRDWVRQELNFSNELSLRNRLNQLISEFPYVLQNFENDQRNFVRFIVDTRNYLTHYSNRTGRANIQDLERLHDICQRMELLIEANLLSRLGFNAETIQRFINNAKRLKGIRDSPQNTPN